MLGPAAATMLVLDGGRGSWLRPVWLLGSLGLCSGFLPALDTFGDGVFALAVVGWPLLPIGLGALRRRRRRS
jgi:hypothetical protein